MNPLPKGVPSMRIIALPLARVKISRDLKYKPDSDASANTMLIFYHFDLISLCGDREDPSWRKKVTKSIMNKATDIWTSLGKAPKESWKLWTYELGQRIADRVDFEELALRNVDPSLGYAVPLSATNKRASDIRKNMTQSDSLPKIPLIYPPLYLGSGACRTLHSPVARLHALLASRGPRHRRGFYLWMFIAPFTAPITLIPIIPNLPFFYCIWRSWSHYKAYRSSQYLSSLLDHELIEPNPSLDLDRLYASSTLSSTSQHLPSSTPASRSSEQKSTFVNAAANKKLETTTGMNTSDSVCILLTREATPRIIEMFGLPKSAAVNMHRAMDQAYRRLEQPS